MSNKTAPFQDSHMQKQCQEYPKKYCVNKCREYVRSDALFKKIQEAARKLAYIILSISKATITENTYVKAYIYP